MMRYVLGPVIALSFAVALAGCGGKPDSSTSSTSSSSSAGSSSAGSSNGGSSNAVASNPVAPNGDLHLFSTETEAQSVCPHDEIVWLNPASGIYHLKGTRLYGHTKRGNYVCRKAADAAGDRDSKAG